MNDNGERWSELKKKFEGKINDQQSTQEQKNEAQDSIDNWEGQRAIESIRLRIVKKNSQNHIVFEFLVTDTDKADFMIRDFCVEMAPLVGKIHSWCIDVVKIPTGSSSDK